MTKTLRSWLVAAALMLSVHAGNPSAATLPSGFFESIAGAGLTNATAMELAPDGRLFVCEQGGTVRVIKNGGLLPDAFAAVSVNSGSERGLLGIAFDPDFATNQYVYVYYTHSTLRNRVSRFTANGDVASGSEVLIFEIDTPLAPGDHNGGAIHFGMDGKLYVAVGDYTNSANSQSMAALPGKMLRLNPDGTIPLDNPFYMTATGKNRAIWALGLRNPFTFGFHRTSGRMFINDVGQSAFEEINDGIAASNYGWPDTEGYTSNPAFRSPLYAYARGGTPFKCAIVGGAFYAPQTMQFPAEYAGDYFFSDLCSGIVQRYKPSTGAVQAFASGAREIVDMKVGADGSLYYLSRTDGAVYKVSYGPSSDERFAIGLGNFNGDAGRMGVHGGQAAGYGPKTTLQVPWAAYTTAGGGARIALGDVDGDGLDEIVAGLASGGAGWLAVFDDAAHGHALMRWVQVPWPSYNSSNGEVFPAVGNLDADPAAEIVAGLGNGGAGFFAVFDDAAANYAHLAWRQLAWPAYNNTNGTTHPSIGDVDGDGQREIVLGLGTGGAGFIAIVDGAAQVFAHRRWVQGHWNTYNTTTGGETWPAVGDVDADGRGEILVGLGPGGGGYVEIIDDSQEEFVNAWWLRFSWNEYNSAQGETHPAVGNLDADAGEEIVVGHGPIANEGGWVEIFDDAAASYARLGWRNAGWVPARQGGAASYPAIGRMR